MKSPLFRVPRTAVLLALLPGALLAQESIGWNYQGGGGVGLAPGDMAGAPGFEQDDWNNHSGNGQGPGDVPLENLLDSSGTATTADVTAWTLATNNSWQHNQTTTPDEILMNNFSDTQPSITFAEIPYTATGYTVVVYYGNNEGPSTSTLTVGTQARTITTGNTDQASVGINGYIEGTDDNTGSPSNYSVFPGKTAATITVSLTGTNNNGISAIQFVEELLTDPPGPPSSPSPENSAFDVPVDVTLDWADSGRADEYDLYLWPFLESQPVTPTATVTTSEYTPPGGLAPTTDYDWKVVARNTSSNATTEGPIWTFTTGDAAPPLDPFQTAPLDGANGVDPAAILEWDEAPLATSYNVYLWIPPAAKPGAPTASLSTTEYDPPGDLVGATTYHWTVEAVNAFGTTPSFDPFWSFTTISPPDGPPANPSPSDTTTEISPLVMLAWDEVPNASSYNVRLWPSTDLRPGDPTASVTDSSYQPDPLLQFSTAYTWEVEAVNALGVTTGGPWTFTTSDSFPGTRKIGWNYQGVGGAGLSFDAVAGAPGFEQTEWNNHAGNLQGPGATPLFDLYDDTFELTTADVVSWTLSTNNSWQHMQTGTPNEVLMNDFTNKEPAITFAEIPYPNYDVVVYYGNNEGPSTSTLMVGSQSREITTGNSAQSSFRSVGFVEGTDSNPTDPTNYSVFTGLTGSGLTVAFSDVTMPNNNGISAIQIVAAEGGPEALVITAFSRSGDTLTIAFTGTPGVNSWKVRASTDLTSFPIDETPTATITETGTPGAYEAVVDVAGDPSPYFLRIEN